MNTSSRERRRSTPGSNISIDTGWCSSSSCCSVGGSSSNRCCQGGSCMCFSRPSSNHSSSCDSSAAGRRGNCPIVRTTGDNTAANTSDCNPPRGGSRSCSSSCCRRQTVCGSSSRRSRCLNADSISGKARKRRRSSKRILAKRKECSRGKLYCAYCRCHNRSRSIGSMSQRSNNGSSSCRYSSARWCASQCGRSNRRSVFWVGRENMSSSLKKRSRSCSGRSRNRRSFFSAVAGASAQKLRWRSWAWQQQEKAPPQKQQHLAQPQQQCSCCFSATAAAVDSSAPDTEQTVLFPLLKQQQQYSSSPLVWQQQQYQQQHQYPQGIPRREEQKEEEERRYKGQWKLEQQKHTQGYRRCMWQQLQKKRNSWILRGQQHHQEPRQQKRDQRQHEQQHHRGHCKTSRQQWQQKQQERKRLTLKKETCEGLLFPSLSKEAASHASAAAVNPKDGFSRYRRAGTAVAQTAGEGGAAAAPAAGGEVATEVPSRRDVTVEAASPSGTAAEVKPEGTTTTRRPLAAMAFITKRAAAGGAPGAAAAPAGHAIAAAARSLAAGATATPGASTSASATGLPVVGRRAAVTERAKTAPTPAAGAASGKATASPTAAKVDYKPVLSLARIPAAAAGRHKTAARGAGPLGLQPAASRGDAAAAGGAATWRDTTGVGGAPAAGAEVMLLNDASTPGGTECTYTAAKLVFQRVSFGRFGARMLYIVLLVLSLRIHAAAEFFSLFLNPPTMASFFFSFHPSPAVHVRPSLPGDLACKCCRENPAPASVRRVAADSAHSSAFAALWSSSPVGTYFPLSKNLASVFPADAYCSCFAAAVADHPPVGHRLKRNAAAVRGAGLGRRTDGGYFLFAAASSTSTEDEEELPSPPNTVVGAEKGEVPAEAAEGTSQETRDEGATGGEGNSAARGNATAEEEREAGDGGTPGNVDSIRAAEPVPNAEQPLESKHPSASPPRLFESRQEPPESPGVLPSSSSSPSLNSKVASALHNEPSPVGDAAAAPSPSTQQQPNTTSVGGGAAATPPASPSSSSFSGKPVSSQPIEQSAGPSETSSSRIYQSKFGSSTEADTPAQSLRKTIRKEDEKVSAGESNPTATSNAQDKPEETAGAAAGEQDASTARATDAPSGQPAPAAGSQAREEGGGGGSEERNRSDGGGGRQVREAGGVEREGTAEAAQEERKRHAPSRRSSVTEKFIFDEDEEEDASESEDEGDEGEEDDDDDDISESVKGGGLLAALNRNLARRRRRQALQALTSSRQSGKKIPHTRAPVPNPRPRPQGPPSGGRFDLVGRKRGALVAAGDRHGVGHSQSRPAGDLQDSGGGSPGRQKQAATGFKGGAGGSRRSYGRTVKPQGHRFGRSIKEAPQRDGGESGQLGQREGERGGGVGSEGGDREAAGREDSGVNGTDVENEEDGTFGGGGGGGAAGGPRDDWHHTSSSAAGGGTGTRTEVHKHAGGGEVSQTPPDEALQALQGGSRHWKIHGEWSRHLGLVAGPAGFGPVREYLVNLSTAGVGQNTSPRGGAAAASQTAEGQRTGADGSEKVLESGGAAAAGGQPSSTPKGEARYGAVDSASPGLPTPVLSPTVLQRRRWYVQHRHRLRIRLEERKALLDQHRPLSETERYALKSIFLINQFQRHHMLNLQAVRSHTGAFAAHPSEDGSVGLLTVNECVAIRYADYPPYFPGYDASTDSCRCPKHWTACSKAEAAATPHSWEPIVRETPGTKCTDTGGEVMLKNMHAYSCGQRDYVQPPPDAPPVPTYIKEKQCRAAEFVLCKATVSHCFTGPWSAWTQCSTPCGDGYQYRWRKEADAAREHLDNKVQPCAPYHMEERRKCNLGACPKTVTNTHCHWTQVQIDRMDYPYDDDRGSCKCGSGDPDFDRAEGGGFMVPCTPAEALASMDNWIDLMQKYCQSVLRHFGKWGFTVRFHPYAQSVKVGLANKWYVDCTGGWAQFASFEERMFCGKGVNILCRPETDTDMRLFETRRPLLSPPTSATLSYLHLREASTVHSFTASTEAGWEVLTFLLLSLACGCAAGVLLLTCFLKRSLLLRYYHAHRLPHQPQQQKHGSLPGRLSAAGGSRQQGGGRVLGNKLRSAMHACVAELDASLGAAKERISFYSRRCFCWGATAAASGCRRASVLLAVRGYRQPAYVFWKLQQQLVKYVREAERKTDGRRRRSVLLLRDPAPFCQYRRLPSGDDGGISAANGDSSEDEQEEQQQQSAAQREISSVTRHSTAAARGGTHTAAACACLAHEEGGFGKGKDAARRSGKNRGMLLQRQIKHREERQASRTAADSAKSRAEVTAAHACQSPERPEKRALRRRRHSSTCSEDTRGSTRSTSNESRAHTLYSSSISDTLFARGGSLHGRGRDCRHRRSSTYDSNSSTHAGRDTSSKENRRKSSKKGRKEDGKSRENLPFNAAAASGSSAPHAEELTLRERITAFGERRGLSPVETLLLYPRLVLLLRREKAKKREK